MLQLGDIDDILLLQIGQEFFEVFQDVIVQVDVDLCLLQFDIFGKLLNNELFALFSIIHAACHHF
jgi:hypothetical protein